MVFKLSCFSLLVFTLLLGMWSDDFSPSTAIYFINNQQLLGARCVHSALKHFKGAFLVKITFCEPKFPKRIEKGRKEEMEGESGRVRGER